MRCLVVHAHPDPQSYSRALRERAVAGLRRAGHEVDVIDLYECGFEPCLSAAEHAGYYAIGLDHPDPLVARHIELLRRSELLVFVYPTWWSGLPAVLKGWLERVMLPEVAFALAADDAGNERVIPLLSQVRRLVGITTYGSKRLDVLVLGDAGRRTVTRTVRLLCHRRCRTTWLGLHELDASSDQTRTGFLERVETKLAAIR